MSNPYEYAYKRLRGKVEWMANNGAPAERLNQWNDILNDLAKGYNAMELKIQQMEDQLLEAEMTARQLVTLNQKLKAIFKMTPIQEKFLEEVLKYPIGIIEAQVKKMQKAEWDMESGYDAATVLFLLEHLNREVKDAKIFSKNYERSNCKAWLDMISQTRKLYPELETELPKD
jgi:hypothetical protein